MIIFLESEFEKILNNCKIPNCGIALDNSFAIGTEQINAMITRFQGSISPMYGYNIYTRWSVDSDVILLKKSPNTSGRKLFYFPWIQGDAIPGHCVVPETNSNIIVTGGMNGCSLYIYKANDKYIFVHNSNDEQLSSDEQKMRFFKYISDTYGLNEYEKKLVLTVKVSEYDYGNKLYLTENFYTYYTPVIIPHGNMHILTILFLFIEENGHSTKTKSYKKHLSYIKNIAIP